MSRSAPEAGYDFGRKREYRRQVWATFRDALKRSGRSVKGTQALLMPSLEGDEIEVAINAGFRESNLHVVDREPAIVATLKRRYRRIHTYGCTLSRAMERMATEGIRIGCANFDFCSQVSDLFVCELTAASIFGSYDLKLVQGKSEIQVFCRKLSGVFEDEALVAVTTLRGREHAKASRTLGKFGGSDDDIDEAYHSARQTLGWDEARYARAAAVEDVFAVYRTIAHVRDRQRLLWIQSCLDADALQQIVEKPLRLAQPHVVLLRWNSYLSASGQTMLWGIFSVECPRRTMQMSIAANKKRIELGIAPVGPLPPINSY